ncbi:sulfatase-like hydrolase/transferase [Lacinutrix jangbogonensis]|uniref:sulfatase-like hydrolase/transferase n=1 Tax=Lacinutrix jangbogonensis TaxID=1469557 RepID=UPI00053E62CD|nr:sulfatase-like hydrolase/transferase [Lacinutrix jangbogonensis]
MIKDLKANLKPILKLTLIMSFPLLVIALVGFFLIPETNLYFRELGALFLHTAIFVGIMLFFNTFKLRKVFLLIFQFLLSFLVAFKLFFYYTFEAKPSASGVFVIFETNAAEASEFFSSYFDFTIGAIISVSFLVFFILILQLVFKQKQFQFLRFKNISLIFKVVTILLIVASAYFLRRSFRDQSLFIISHSIQEYNIAKNYYKEHLAKQENQSIKINSKNEKPQVGIVIIGESTSRWHMQLYNYNRETNPILSKMKDELFIFNDVIAPEVMTIKSLEKSLTLSDHNNPKAENNFSIVQLANAAGFETFWISNQQPVGFTESTPTIIATAAKHKQFLATDSYFYSIYDEALIPEIRNAIKTESKRKLIFVHLIGTHRLYPKRYTKEFDYFEGVNERTKYKTAYSKAKVNEYDNAVRYNDFVVSEIIKLTKAENENSFVVYFSDHGDDVFDTQDFVGHHGHKGSKPMFDVPFLAWFSDDYLNNNKRIDTLNNYENRKYNAEDFIYSFSDIINLDFEGFDATRSIFSSSFKERKRLIKERLDYDTWEE